VKAPSGPLLCHGSAGDPANRMRMRCGSTLLRQPATLHDGRAEHRPHGCHYGRQDRGSSPVGFRSVPVGGAGAGVFTDGRRWWWTGAEYGAGAGGELSSRENIEASRPVMATCSPRVGIMLAGAPQTRLRRRHICQPPQASPASPITHVDGSGTATGLARRKPFSLPPNCDWFAIL
jgi:hypothetical protein